MRMVGIGCSVTNLDANYIFKEYPVKLLFACEHIHFNKLGYNCTQGEAERKSNLAELLLD